MNNKILANDCKKCISADVCSVDNKLSNSLLGDCPHFRCKANCFVTRCNIGDTVYYPIENNSIIQEYTITEIKISEKGIWYSWKLKDGKGLLPSTSSGFVDEAIGKTVFLSVF